jgi:hypothetical protein
MNERKDFLSRWSRRKLESEANAAPAEKTALAPAETRKTETSAETAAAPVAEFDLTTLPSLESIGANSDVIAFLQHGVPASLTRAALRRAWSADPAIRDFVGLSENSWDFNAPDSMPGFGALDAGDARRLAAQFFGEPGEDAAGRSSQNRHSLDQPAPDAGETETPRVHEMRNADLEGTDTPAEDEVQGVKIPADKDKRADILSAVHQPKQDGAAQHHEGKNQDESKPVARRHGGALPE